MTITKHQFERKEILHALLSKQKLSKEELFDALNRSLENRGLDPISIRTMYTDLETLQNEGAKVHRPEAGDNCYYYEEHFFPKGYGFSDEDIDILQQAVSLLKSVAGFNIARDVEEILQRQKFTRHLMDFEKKGFIAFEDHTLASGSHYLENLADAIYFMSPLIIRYKPFLKHEETFVFHPYFLKEYRNRWFVFGMNQKLNRISNLALDRILSLKNSEEKFIPNTIFNPDKYFKDLIGVTRPDESKPMKIEIEVFGNTIPYIETKKIHHSQETIENRPNSIVISLFVIINYELISTLLGFGPGLKVLGPEELVEIISNNIKKCYEQYLPENLTNLI